jgi:Ca2+-binding RTX toxin-like protein
MRYRLSTGALLLATCVCGTAAAAPSSTNVIRGTNGPDVITATPERDVIYAMSGNDEVREVGDGDVVYAGSGNDLVTTVPLVSVHDVRIEGNVGHDTISGAGVDSYVNADSGNDDVQFEGCRNRILTGSGNDSFGGLGSCYAPDRGTLSMGNGNDEARVGSGRLISLGNGNDVLDARYADVLQAGSGNDIVELELGRSEDGGAGIVFLASGNDSLRIVNTGGAEVYAGNGADRIFAGHSGANVIHGQSGNDVVELGDENLDNRLDGGSGRDWARLSPRATGTTCTRIERITDLAGAPRSCS